MLRTQPGPGQESVWDYPRPPRLERTSKRIRVVFAGVTLAESSGCWRVLETSHPPVYYIPRADIRMEFLKATERRSFCEFKGSATYWSIAAGDRVSADAGWSYEDPTRAFAGLRGCIAFYATRVDECFVDEEKIEPQKGDFYGGWITRDVVGPFKGGVGTGGW